MSSRTSTFKLKNITLLVIKAMPHSLCVIKNETFYTFLECSQGLKIRTLSVSFNQEPLDGQRYVSVFKKLSLGRGSLDRTIFRYLVIRMSRQSCWVRPTEPWFRRIANSRKSSDILCKDENAVLCRWVHLVRMNFQDEFLIDSLEWYKNRLYQCGKFSVTIF